MKTFMKRTIEFGKIAYGADNKRRNLVTVDLELREKGGEDIFTIDPKTKERVYTGEQTERYVEFSACGNIWNAFRTDILSGGQILDEIKKYVKNPLFKEIHGFWKKYHLNGMHAGTEEQDAEIERWKAEGHVYDYKEVCEHLKEVGLYEVEYKGKPYRYGSAWLHRDIPEKDLNRIKAIITDEAEQGRIVIPPHMREALNLKKGSEVAIDLTKDGKLEIAPAYATCYVCGANITEPNHVQVAAWNGTRHICNLCTSIIVKRSLE